MAQPSDVSYRDAPFIVFSDFDGTITDQDSNDYMTDNLGFGREKRLQQNQDTLNGKIHFRDSFRQMLESVSERHKFDECRELVKKAITLDPGFKHFFEWSKEANVPVVIVSSGMVPIIRAILENLLGPEDAKRMEIIANEAVIHPDGHFDVKFRHPESGYGHDKSKALRVYRDLNPKPTIFFCGDGVSDMSAAGEADVLFVKCPKGIKSDLAKHCDRNNFDYLPFETFTEVTEHVKAVVEGKLSVEELNKKGREIATKA